MAAVAFDPAAFRTRYPVFAGVADAVLSACFTEAGLYLSNSDASPVQDLARRAMLLNMLTAHVATLGGALSADGQPLPVGRVSSASEGAVSVSTDFAPAGSAAWFAQTQYGAAFWQATTALRSFVYIPQPTRY